MNGLLDFLKTPAGQGLLSAGLGIAANAGKGGTWNAIGRGGLMGLQGYTGAIENERMQEENKVARDFRTLQMDKYRRDLQTEDQIRAAAQASTISPERANALSQGPMPDGSAVPQVAPGFDSTAYMNRLFSIDPTKAVAFQQSLAKDSKFNKVDPKDYTGPSVAKFSMTGNYADLVPVRKREVATNGQVYDPYEVQPGAVFADPNKPFSIGANGQPTANLPFQQFEVRKAGAGAPRVNVNTDKSYFGNVAEGLAKNDVAAIEAARSGPERVETARRVKDILQRSPITGTGAEVRTSLQKALATAGLIDGKDVADTEVLASTLASQALDAIKTSGLGGGNGFSNADRDFLERARSGKIDMTPQALGRIADLNERIAVATIKRGNIVIGKLRANPKAGDMGQGLDLVPEPSPAQSKPNGQAFATMPPANPGNRGKFLTDQQTGKRFQSNGMQWVEVK